MIPYPTESKENVRFRANLLSGTIEDEQLKRSIYFACQKDILFWINAFCWIYDAKGDIHQKLGYDTPHMPFITWPYQDEYILWIQDKIVKGEDGLTEKSRDMGATWMVLSVIQHFWQFGEPGHDFLLGSRKEEYVDKFDSIKPLFPKIRYQLKRQPDFLMPIGYEQRKHDNYMKLVNPENGNIIEGESTNTNFGSGGRYKACLLDEFAKWEHTDASAWQSLSDVTNCRLPISSAKGKNNQFYSLRAGDVGNIEVKRLFWKQHPLKDDEWYAKEKKRRSDEDLAAEVDIDYSASVSNKAYESFNANIHCVKPVYDTYLPINLMMDFNVDPMCWAIGQEVKGIDRFIDEISIQSTITETAIFKFVEDYKNHKKKFVYIYGDATGRSGSTKSKYSDYDIIKKILKAHKWEYVMQVPLANPSIKESLVIANKRLRDWEHDNKSWVEIDEKKCKVLVDSFEQTRRLDDGIDKKDNVEHMTDGVRYKWAWQYPTYESIAYSEDI